MEYGVTPLSVAKTMSGLELLRGMMAGRLPAPPISRTMNFTLAEAEEGYALFTGTPLFDYYNPIGSVHGGWVATLLDSCMGCAVHSHMKPGFGYTSLEIKVNFVRPVLDTTGPVRAEGRSIYTGNRTATAEGKLLDAKGRLLAHGTTTCLVFPLP